jgi:hypothetical protein
MFVRIDTSTAEYAKMFHGGLSREEETNNDKRCGNPHLEAGRLLQESEESRHALSIQPSEEVTSQTAPSRRRGDYTAMHTRSNKPEGAS